MTRQDVDRPARATPRRWWRAVTASGPVADRARAGLLVTVLWTVVAVWTLAAAAPLVLDGRGADGAAGSPTPGADGDIAAAPSATAGPRRGPALRSDLFDAPAPRKAAAKVEPKTNPVELLALIELQGVLGGDAPRAMVRYKRTGEAVIVSAGDDLGEFKVAEIRKRSVVLSWRNELFELSL
jgi:hypothetical protein